MRNQSGQSNPMRVPLALLGGALLLLAPSAAFSATGCEQLRRACMDYCRYQNPAMDHRECKRECRSRVKKCHTGGRMMPGGMPGGYGQTDREPDFTGMPGGDRYGAPGAGGMMPGGMPGGYGQTQREPDFTGMPGGGRYGAPGAGGHPMPPRGGGSGYPGYPMGQYPQAGYPAAAPSGQPSGAAPAPAQPAAPEGQAGAAAPATRPPVPQYPGYPPSAPYGMYPPGAYGPQGGYYPPYGRGY